jgi:hypothetical protein
MKIAELKQVSSRPDVVEVRMFYMVQLVSSCWVSVSFNAVMQMLLHNFLFIFQVWDATAADPKLLVFLKSYRNTVPVPRHWCQKRKFLQVSQHPNLIIIGYQVFQLRRKFPLAKFTYVDDASMSDGCALHE